LKNVHKLTEGAILLAVFAVLLLITLYIPILGTIVTLVLALPFILFAAKNKRSSLLVFLVASVLISLIVGTFLAVPLTLAFGMTGLVLGDFIREKRSRGAAFIAGTLMFLLNLIIQYGVSIFFFKVDFIKDSITMLRESVEQAQSMLNALGQNANTPALEQFNTGIDMLQSLIPSIFVMGSIMVVFIIQLISMPIIKRLGVEVNTSGEFKDLLLPRSLFYYFLIAMVASMVLNPESGSYLYLAVTNITFILQFLLMIQGLSFVWFISSLKGLPKAVPIIVTVVVFLIPIFLYIVWILGIIDLGLDVRKRLVK
jgi:uncharacterized protein YybS (DUF2232 family)